MNFFFSVWAESGFEGFGFKQKILGPLFRPQIYNSKKMVDLKK